MGALCFHFFPFVAPPLSSPLGLRGCFTFVQPPFGAITNPNEVDFSKKAIKKQTIKTYFLTVF